MEALVLSVVGGGLFLALVGRYNTQLVLRGWEALLSPAALRALKRLEEQVETDSLLAERAHGKALRARGERRLAEASRLVALAAAVVSDAVPERLQRLPPPPLLPRAFALREIASLAGLSAFLHQFLVATHERFRLRVWTLGACYLVVRHVATASASRIGPQTPATSSPWDSFESALHDFTTLDREHVEAFKALLLSLQQPSPPQLNG
jgi:hypothetical protein